MYQLKKKEKVSTTMKRTIVELQMHFIVQIWGIGWNLAKMFIRIPSIQNHSGPNDTAPFHPLNDVISGITLFPLMAVIKLPLNSLKPT